MKKGYTIAISLALLAGAPLWASGFGLFEQGTQGMGNAGAYVARAEDASAIFYNPAGLAQLSHTELSLSSRATFVQSFYSNAGQTTWDTEKDQSIAPEFFVNFKWGRLAIGLGSALTYDYNSEWKDADFPSRYLSTGTEHSVREHMIALAYKLSDHFSIGATYRLGQLDSTYTRVLPRSLDANDETLFYEASEAFETDGDDGGFTLGFQYYQSRRLSFGFAYQSPITISASGNRSYALLTRLNDQRAIDSFNTFRSAPIQTSFDLPERYQIGGSTRVTVRTRIEVDISLDDWSEVEQTIYQDPATPSDTVVINRQWDDAYTFRLAGDFQQRKALLWRVGIAATSASPVPDETLESGFPDGERFLYSFGLSYTLRRKYTLEAAWMFMQNRDRSVEDKELVFASDSPTYYQSNGQDGVFETTRFLFNLGLKIRFGKSAGDNGSSNN